MFVSRKKVLKGTGKISLVIFYLVLHNRAQCKENFWVFLIFIKNAKGQYKYLDRKIDRKIKYALIIQNVHFYQNFSVFSFLPPNNYSYKYCFPYCLFCKKKVVNSVYMCWCSLLFLWVAGLFSQIRLSLYGLCYLNSNRRICICFALFVILTVICYLGLDTKLSTYNQNEVALDHCKVVYEEVPTKIYFLCTKTKSTVNLA